MDCRTKKERKAPGDLYHISPHRIKVGGSVRPRWQLHSFEYAVWCVCGLESAKRLAGLVYSSWEEGCRLGYMGFTRRSSYPASHDTGCIRGLWIYRVKPTGPMIRTEGDGWKSAFALKVTGIAAGHGDPESNSMPPAPAYSFREYAALKTIAPDPRCVPEQPADVSRLDARELRKWRYLILSPEDQDYMASPDCELIKLRAFETAEELLKLYRDFRKPGKALRDFKMSDRVRIKSADKVEEFITKVIPEEADYLEICGGFGAHRTAADLQCIFRACVCDDAIDVKALTSSLAAWIHRRVEEEAKRAEQEYRKAHRKLTRDPRYDRARERKEERKRSGE